MEKVIECVPNFSEGTDKEIINKIIQAIKDVEDIEIWDHISDKNHNRTFVTFAGTPEKVKEASIKLALKAAELIDMRKHRGGHPRIGSIDVIPFIPLKNTSLEECNIIANDVARELSIKLNIPVYLYGEAANKEERKKISYIQTIQYENLFEKIKDDEYTPDFGPSKVNEKLGGTLVGTRPILVAFNVNLDTDNIEIANEIARNIRESSGGLRNVKAIGVEVDDRNIVQVSMDLVNYKETPLYQPYELIKIEARRYGVQLLDSELVGIIPSDALIDSAEYYFNLKNFDKMQIIESRL